jgi:hypothetical protein
VAGAGVYDSLGTKEVKLGSRSPQHLIESTKMSLGADFMRAYRIFARG